MAGAALTSSDESRRTDSPPLQGRGKGWGLSANTISELQSRARQMRNNPTEPETRLWRHLSNSKVQGAKFRRQQVIGRYIADFVCSTAKLIVAVDGDTHDTVADARRDAALAGLGYSTLRFTNRDVMENIEGVLARIAEALNPCSLPFRGRGFPSCVAPAERPHPNPSPEGEGLRVPSA